MLPERRSTFVLNTTISEMILLLFFLLLLLLAFSNIRNTENETRSAAKLAHMVEAERLAAELKQRVERLQAFYDQIVSKLPEPERAGVADTLVAIDKLRASIADLSKKKEDLEKDILAHEALIEKLSRKIPIAEVSSEMKKEIGDLALCQQAKTEMPAMRARTNGLEMDNQNLRQIAKEATAKAARCGGKGEEYVACWRDPDTKKIQYVYEVYLEANLIRVERKWPESRAPEMARFPGERALVGRTVSVADFLRDTATIFAQSVRDSCRHYVVISGDRSKMNADMFAQFIRVQDHFYKQSNIK